MGSAPENSRDGSEEQRGVDEAVASLAGARANPLPVEIPVNATGTRPGSGPDKRELFSEDTDTVLVFPDGAVIRLCAAVATGQLIFLTNKNSNSEVVCQVVGKRIHRPTSCYVELLFTEAMPDFWNVTFPEPSAAAPSAGAEVQSITSAEITEDGAEVHAPLPTDEEVETLREEVEARRKQLEQLKQMKESARAVAQMAEPEIVPAPVAPVVGAANVLAETPREAVPMKLSVVEERTEVMSANEPAPSFAPTFTPATVIAPTTTPLVPPQVAAAASEQVPPAPWKSFGLAEDIAAATKRIPAQSSVASQSERKPQVAMSLPNRDLTPKVDPEQELIDQLLPQPALDFSKAPAYVSGVDPDDPYSIYKPTRAKMEKWVLAALTIVLVAAMGVAVWKLGLIQNLTRTRAKKVESLAQSNVVPAVIPTVTESSEGGASLSSNAEAIGGNAAALTPAEEVNVNRTAAGPAGSASSNAPGRKEKEGANAADFHTAGPTPEAARKANRAAKDAKKKDPVAAQPVEAPAEAPIPEDAPVVPAKLLKAVSPVYPPDAMNNFITGDVKLKADLDEKGQIRDIEVISGPAALRPAAMDAMKQYEYAPATKGGRAVGSQVHVTIKFWFDP